MKRNCIFIAIIITLTLIVHTYSQDTPNREPDRGFQPGQSFSLSDIESINLTNGNLMLNFPFAALPKGRGTATAGIALSYNSKIWGMRTEKTLDSSNHLVEQGFLNSSDDGGWQYGLDYRLEIENRQLSADEPYQCTTSSHQPDYRSIYQWKVKVHFPDGTIREFRPTGYSDTFPPQHGPQPDGYYNVHPNGTIRNVTFTAFEDPYTGQTRWGCNITESLHPVDYMTYYSTDGSYLKLVYQRTGAWTVYFPDGSRVERDANYGQQRVYDRNGNFVFTGSVTLPDGNTAGGWIDQFGRYVAKRHDVSKREDYIYRKGVGGEVLKWTVKWKDVWVRKQYRTLGMSSGRERGGSSEQIALEAFESVEKITLPEQLGSLAYSFSYYGDDSEPTGGTYSSGWGELATVTLPSGANTLYTYNILLGENSLFEDEYDSLGAVFINPNHVIKRSVRTKTLSYTESYDGQTEARSETWNYRIGKTTSDVTGPDGSVESQLHGNTEYENPYSGLVLKQTKPDGTTIEKFWMQNLPNAGLSVTRAQELRFNQYVKAEIVTIPDVAGSPYLSAIREFSFDKNGNQTRVAEYDFVSPSLIQRDVTGRVTAIPSGLTPLRITETSFHSPTEDASDTAANNQNSYWNTSSPAVRNAARTTALKSGAGVVASFSEFTYDNPLTTANVTETRTWDSHKGGTYQPFTDPLTAANSVSASVQYDAWGNPTLTTDANGVQTLTTYGAVGGFTGLYPTEVKSAYGTSVQQTVQTVYDLSTGLPTRVTALGNTPAENVVSETEYDPVGRPVKTKALVNNPLEIWTTTEYNDTERRVITRSDLEAKGDGRKIAVAHYDELGRVRLSRTIENLATEDPYDESDGIKVQTRYMISGTQNFKLVSNPYRAATSGAAGSEASMGWTISRVNSTGTVSETETFAGSALPAPFGTQNTASSGVVRTETFSNLTLVTDQAGNRRMSKANALGQLSDVWEIKSADNDTETVAFGNQQLTALRTGYLYDLASNLTGVGQGQQSRSFAYSSLSRLMSATNPESGTIQYRYDATGNLTRKTDARQVVTDYVYDPLGRVTARNYSNEPSGQTPTPNVAYTYDDPAVPHSRGKLTKVASSVSETKYLAFDAAGRVLSSLQLTDGAPANPSLYNYNLSGALIEQTYPSGRVVKSTLSADGDLMQVQSAKANQTLRNYANGFTYTAAGAVTAMRLGNGKWESTQYNSRLQPTRIGLGGSASDQSLLKLDYTYGVVENNQLNTAKNNGNIQSQTITVPTVGSSNGFTAVQTYIYDSLNRIDDATEMVTPAGTNTATQSWRQDYRFDRYGNLNFVEANTTTIPRNCADSATPPNPVICDEDRKVFNPGINAANNRLSSSDGYLFDAAGNTTRDPQMRKFTYDAENKQTKVQSVNSSGTVTGTIGEYFYDGDGRRVKKIAYSNNQVTETTVFVYDASSRLVAEYSTTPNPTPQVAYLTNDHLGSPRINTNELGAVISRHDYRPYGEEVAERTHSQYAADTIRKQFTGYERDDETVLDFAQARYYAKNFGRFNCVDPIIMTKERLVDPQAINLYVYARNNPLNLVDPTGEDFEITAKNEAEARKHFETYLLGIQKNDRSAVTFFVGDGKNGYTKGSFYILVDSNHTSNSTNFQYAKTAANDRTSLTKMRVIVDGETYSFRGTDPTGTRISPTPTVATFNNDFDGYTFFEYRGGQPEPNTLYSTGNYTELVINGNPDQTPFQGQVRLNITNSMHHELKHAVLGDFGRDVVAGSHPPLGPASVDAEMQKGDREIRQINPIIKIQIPKRCCIRHPNSKFEF